MNFALAMTRLMLPVVVLLLAVPAAAADGTNAAPPATAREFYNAGTRLLASQKFAEAEKMFQSALAAQDERVQPATLYNLGQTRFADGLALLKKGPDAQKTAARGRAALAEGDRAIGMAGAALAENNLEKIVAAYYAGRGVRHNLREAEKAVQTALETYGKTLQKWQRAADDFKGAAELNPADTNAVHNEEVVEHNLARLVDELRKMQEMLGLMGKQKQELGKMLGKLKGQMPGPNAPPGAGGEEEEDEDGVKPESLTGKEERAGRDGDQLPLSPDQAGQILDGLSVDGTRRLTMSDQQGATPKEKTGRTW